MPESMTAHARPSVSAGKTRLAASAFTVRRERHSVALTSRLRLTDHNGETLKRDVVARVPQYFEDLTREVSDVVKLLRARLLV